MEMKREEIHSISCCPNLLSIETEEAEENARRKNGGHYCEEENSFIDVCWERADGMFAISINGGEYEEVTHFCPICGMKAPTKPYRD